MNNPYLILACVVWIACAAVGIASKSAEALTIAFNITLCIWVVWLFKGSME